MENRDNSERGNREFYRPYIVFERYEELNTNTTYIKNVGGTLQAHMNDNKWYFEMECLPVERRKLDNLKALLENYLSDYQGLRLRDIIKTADFKRLRSFYRERIDHNINRSSILMYHSPAHAADISHNSCYYRINHFYDTGTMLTGDIDLSADETMNIFRHFKKTGIMSVPHHGSLHGAEIYANHPIPPIQVISCGQRNRYKHPHPVILDKLWNKRIIRCDEQKQWRYTVYAFYPD